MAQSERCPAVATQIKTITLSAESKLALAVAATEPAYPIRRARPLAQVGGVEATIRAGAGFISLVVRSGVVSAYPSVAILVVPPKTFALARACAGEQVARRAF